MTLIGLLASSQALSAPPATSASPAASVAKTSSTVPVLPASAAVTLQSASVPDGIHVSVTLDEKDKPIAAANGLSFMSEVSLAVTGEWKSAPESPQLTATFEFTIPEGATALGVSLKPMVGSPIAGARRKLHKYTAPIPLAATTQLISIVNNRGVVVPFRVGLKVELSKPAVVLDPACGNLGLTASLDGVEQKKPRSTEKGSQASVAVHPLYLTQPLLAFVQCTREGSGISIKAWTWKNFRWETPAPGTSGRWQLDAANPVIKGVLPLYPESAASQHMVLPISSAAHRKQPIANLTLSQTDQRAPTWQVSAGIGPTWSTYTETATGLPTVKVSQLSLTGKVQAQFRIKPPRWNMALSMFGTIVPMGATPSTMPTARWVGVNLRAGYSAPLGSSGRSSLGIMPGAYAWSMFVDGNQYGIQNLNGPQLVLAYNQELGSHWGKAVTLQRIGAYVKFAAVTPGFALPDLNDHELAGGGSVTFRFSFIPRPLVFSADYSTLDFGFNGFSASLQTMSASIGMSLF